MQHSEKLRDLLRLSHEIRSIPVHTPRIVVIGGSQCGKSSLIERMVGKRFLPRGTTWPIQISVTGNSPREYATVSSFDDKQFEMAELKDVLGDLMEEMGNDRKATSVDYVTANPIEVSMKVKPPVFLDIVDLPGMVTNRDIRSRAISLAYISEKTSIIIAVTAADVYLEKGPNACKQSSIYFEVDEKGRRTLNVISKIDKLTISEIDKLLSLRERGMMMTIANLLEGEKSPKALKRRKGEASREILKAQQELQARQKLREKQRMQAEAQKEPKRMSLKGFGFGKSRRKEETKRTQPFVKPMTLEPQESSPPPPSFSSKGEEAEYDENYIFPDDLHVLYRRLDSLTYFYVHARMNKLLKAVDKKVEQYQNLILYSQMDEKAFMLQACDDFCQAFSESLDRGVFKEETFVSLITGSALIRYYNDCLFMPQVYAIDVKKIIAEYDVPTAIRNMQGASSASFVPLHLISNIMDPLLKSLVTPSMYFLQIVSDIMIQMVEECMPKQLQVSTHESVFLLLTERFTLAQPHPKLWEQMKNFASILIRDCGVPARNFIEDIIEMEKSYVNIHHEDLKGAGLLGTGASIVQEREEDMLDDEWSVVDPKETGVRRVQRDVSSARLPRLASVVKVEKASSQSLEIESFTENYFDIVRGKLVDMVPKAVQNWVVETTVRRMFAHLIRSFSKDDIELDYLSVEEKESNISYYNGEISRLDVFRSTLEDVRDVDVHQMLIKGKEAEKKKLKEREQEKKSKPN